MDLASSKLPLVSAAIGGLLIALSFVWGHIVPPPNISFDQIQQRFRAQEKGHAASAAMLDAGSGTEDHSELDAAVPPVDASTDGSEQLKDSDLRAQQHAAEAVLRRALFWRETAPMLVRYVGVALAAIGSILYPIQLLIRQDKAEEEEEDSATVVD